MENINNLYVNSFEFLELDLEGLRLLLNVNHQGLPDCDFRLNTNDGSKESLLNQKNNLYKKSRPYSTKCGAQEGSDNSTIPQGKC